MEHKWILCLDFASVPKIISLWTVYASILKSKAFLVPRIKVHFLSYYFNAIWCMCYWREHYNLEYFLIFCFNSSVLYIIYFIELYFVHTVHHFLKFNFLRINMFVVTRNRFVFCFVSRLDFELLRRYYFLKINFLNSNKVLLTVGKEMGSAEWD